MYAKTIVVFGATGDLSRRKIIPALETLFLKGLLQDTKVIGCARSAANREEWLERLGREYNDEFLTQMYHHKCDLADAKSLESIPVEGDSTFFLSVPPEQYENAIRNLKASGHSTTPTPRVLLLKNPLGPDLQSAHHLQSVVDGCLREKQVYRIDHYLGKDTVNNILATRFSNTVLEPLWNRNYVRSAIFATGPLVAKAEHNTMMVLVLFVTCYRTTCFRCCR